jgi:DNA-binding MarR family transcriptional regulator
MEHMPNSAPSPALSEKQLEKSLYDLNDIYRRHQDYIKTKYKVNAIEMEIIQYVVKDGKKKMKELGDYFDIKLSTLTSIIDKIEKQKLVKRVNSKDDRRVVYLEVSKKGEKLYSDYLRYIQVISQMMANSLDDREYNGFVSGLEIMTRMVTSAEIPVNA